MKNDIMDGHNFPMAPKRSLSPCLLGSNANIGQTRRPGGHCVQVFAIT